jgi:hypothetical protein
MPGFSAGMLPVICFRHLHAARRPAVSRAAASRLLTPEQQASGGAPPPPLPVA